MKLVNIKCLEREVELEYLKGSTYINDNRSYQYHKYDDIFKTISSSDKSNKSSQDVPSIPNLIKLQVPPRNKLVLCWYNPLIGCKKYQRRYIPYKKIEATPGEQHAYYLFNDSKECAGDDFTKGLLYDLSDIENHNNDKETRIGVLTKNYQCTN